MESMQFDKYVALDILNRVHISIEHIEERSQPYHCGDDFLMSSTGVAILDSICMQFIAIGESLIPPTFYAVSDKITIFVHLKTTKK